MFLMSVNRLVAVPGRGNGLTISMSRDGRRVGSVSAGLVLDVGEVYGSIASLFFRRLVGLSVAGELGIVFAGEDLGDRAQRRGR